MSNYREKVRAPIQDNVKNDTTKGVRRKIGAQIRMDMEAYINEYPDKKLALINDENGDVQRWLDAGADLIPAKVKGRKVYDGFNDKSDSEWVRFVAGQKASGEAYYSYGIMMDPDLYDDYKAAPQRQRHEDVRNAMRGGVSSESATFEGGKNMRSYAPNLPTGNGKGYNEIRAK